SSFMSELRFDLVIAISSNGYNKIIDALRNGKTLTTYIPFKNKDDKLVNIQGFIEGSNSSLPPLILTAHFDHLGSDSQNNIYYGALDNASGTSFLLELANTLSTFSKPKRSIIFVALNAEELGLKGSSFFVENNYFDIKNSKVINFDMIGAKNCPITFIQGTSFKGNSSNILTSLSNICSKNSVDYIVKYENSSDHASFNDLGIDALTICHNDTSNIHTPTDTVDYIDAESINTVYKIVNKEIKKDCYNPVTTFIYSKKSINLFLIILLGLIIIGLINIKPFKKSS
ncbi:MAG: M28 family metallopeptidase, partial [Clostridium sp.]|nr:M28 family metallopeptidase [Clostridium sp.]